MRATEMQSISHIKISNNISHFFLGGGGYSYIRVQTAKTVDYKRIYHDMNI